MKNFKKIKCNVREAISIIETAKENTELVVCGKDGLAKIANALRKRFGLNCDSDKDNPCFALDLSGIEAADVISKFDMCHNLVEIIIPKCVTRLPTHAFFICNKLESVVFSGEIKEIGTEAFAGCKNAIIKLPDGIEKICPRAFNGVANILPNENVNNFCIENGLLLNADKTKIISVFKESITIPKPIKKLEDKIFDYCKPIRDIFFEKHDNIA